MQKVSTNLNSFLNEGSKSVVLKRGYGTRGPISVSPAAPLRNKVLSYIAENAKVSRTDLRNFIAGLNEGKSKPAATSMWLKRNSQYFIAENKNGQIFYKLSDLGKRIVSKLNPSPNQTTVISEGKGGCGCSKPNGGTRRVLENECECDYEDEEYQDEFEDDEYQSDFEIDSDDDFEEDSDDNFRRDFERDSDDEFEDDEIQGLRNNRREDRKFDFVDRKRGYERPGIYDMEEDFDGTQDSFENNRKNYGVEESAKRIIEKIRAKRAAKMNEDVDEESETGEEEAEEHNALAVLSFSAECECDKDELVSRLASIGIIGDVNEEGEIEIHEIEEMESETEEETEEETIDEPMDDEDQIEESTESSDDEEPIDLGIDDESSEDEEDSNEEDADNEDSNEEDTDEDTDEKVEIKEFVITVENVEEALEQLEEKGVTAESVEGEENQIKVQADDWSKLKEWLEEKGVDVEELLGGDVEEEESEESEEDIDLSDIDFGGEAEGETEDDENSEEIESDEEDGQEAEDEEETEETK